MATYKVNYVNLRTTRHETATLANGMQFNHIDGVQRGILVLRDAFTDKIRNAYEVFAYFHRYDATGSPVQFKRQKTELSEKEIRKRLEKNKGVEVLANVEEDFTVPLVERPKTALPTASAPTETTYVPLERYLMETHGAFSKSQKKRTQVIKQNGIKS